MGSIGVGDTAYFGPEPEFFVFDDVKYEAEMNSCFYKLDSAEGPYNSGKKFDEGNMGHRPGIKGGYFPVPPVDSAQDLRSEMVLSLVDMGVEMEKHHHEVATSQHELGMKFGTLIDTADNVQLYKYAVQNVAHSFGQTATFMPNQLLVIMELVCILINLFGKMASRYSQATNTPNYLKHAYITLVVLSNMLKL